MMTLSVYSETWNDAVRAASEVWVRGTNPAEYQTRMGDTVRAALRELKIEIEIIDRVDVMQARAVGGD